MLLPDWADTYRQLPAEGAAEPGQWRTDRTPYMRRILECMSLIHPANEVVVMGGAQFGKTESLLNLLGQIIHQTPCPAMVLMPTEETARDWSRDRFTTMIEATPELRSKFKVSSKNPDNSITRKAFPGGYIKLAWATSPNMLRSRPTRVVVMDEIDGYATTPEGDACELIEVRARTFQDARKIVKCSTPTDAHTSKIEPAFLRGTQEYYHVPCPHCGAMQRLEWERIKWPAGEPEKAYYECAECEGPAYEADKIRMLDKGDWVAANDAPEPGVVSFHVSALYSPWFTWGEAALQFARAVKSRTKELLRVFVNTTLGETWRDRGETPDWEKLYLRREPYMRGTVPDGGRVLTMGVDVQRDRLEAEIVAWGENLRSWSVDYIQLPGDPSQPYVWEQLDALIEAEYEHESGGRMKISRTAIDSGFETQHVYRFCRRHSASRVMAVKGSARLTTPLGRPSQVDLDTGGHRIEGGATMWQVGVDVLKDELYSWLIQPLPGEGQDDPRGWCRWPEYGQDYFKGLASEERQIRGSKLLWVKVFERNEPLDCRVYARAACVALGVDRWPKSRWDREKQDIIDSSGRPDARPAGAPPQRRSRESLMDW